MTFFRFRPHCNLVNGRAAQPYGRPLRFEPLEERRYLSISPWSPVEHSAISLTKQTYFAAADFDAYALDVQQLQASLADDIGVVAVATETPAPMQIALPNPAGEFDWFSVVETPIMAPELAAEFPEIHTYRGQGITNPTETLAFDVTPAGFHAQVLSPSGSYYIDPYYYLDDSLYAVYSSQNMFAVPDFSECGGDADCACGDEKPV